MRAKFKKSKNPEIYQELKDKRGKFEERALHYASLTLPNIMSAHEGNNHVSTQHGWQGIGAQCVNHLANKLALTLFPAQQSFFTLDVNELGEKKLAEEGFEKTEMTTIFAQIAKRAIREAEDTAFRAALVEAFKHLLITGNVCLYLPPSKGAKMQALPLSTYVVKRDVSGNVVDFVVLQEKALNTFEPSMQAMIRASKSPQKLKDAESIKLYTRAQRMPEGKFQVTQSADEITVGDVSLVTEEKLPFLPITWRRNYGEDYGRGLVEDHSGDFFVIKFLSEAQARGMAMMADVKFLVKPGSLTDVNKLMKARSGDVLYGVEGDIHILQLGKYADFTPIKVVLDEYKQRVGQVFLLASLVRRDAERVTAYEVRTDALELEQSLGGAYSLFSATLQKPLALWFVSRVKSSIISKIDVTVATGLAALGQMAELEKLHQLSELLSLPASWGQEFQQMLDTQAYLKWSLAQLSMDAPFFKSDDQLAQEGQADEANEQEQMMAQEAAKAIPNVIEQQVQQQQG